jgi:hypothetical protein
MKLQSVWTKKKSEIFDVSFLLPFMLLYRKENSESDSYCRHNVRSSRLFLSRRKRNPLIFLPRISKSTPCKGILTFFLFSKIENVEYFYKHLGCFFFLSSLSFLVYHRYTAFCVRYFDESCFCISY